MYSRQLAPSCNVLCLRCSFYQFIRHQCGRIGHCGPTSVLRYLGEFFGPTWILGRCICDDHPPRAPLFQERQIRTLWWNSLELTIPTTNGNGRCCCSGFLFWSCGALHGSDLVCWSNRKYNRGYRVWDGLRCECYSLCPLEMDGDQMEGAIMKESVFSFRDNEGV